ncbi:nitroreductase family protein [Candidatus Woesearchaeota archaeon]|nr:nitroreductase family protein [Candidatus Woesearchaeota archaeon]
MDALTNIFSRRSIRSYEKKEVEFEKLVNILDAGRFAPSAGNVQDWKFILVNEEDKIEKVGNACLEQDWVDEAQVMVVVCSEPVKEDRMYGDRGKNLYSIQNSACAAQNMLLAAHAQGLGGCWVGSFDEITIRELFDIPEDVVPRAILTFGYPAEKAEEKPKLNLYDVAFFNKWGIRAHDKSEIQRLLSSVLGPLKERFHKLKNLLPSKK